MVLIKGCVDGDGADHGPGCEGDGQEGGGHGGGQSGVVAAVGSGAVIVQVVTEEAQADQGV